MVTNDLGACEWFVWDLRRSSLIDRGHLDQIVSEFLKRNPRAEAPALAEYLVQQNTLTAFQADRILNGKTAGLVLGPYVLLDAIGTGSMGQVFKANSKNDNAMYAVKVLPRRSMWNVRLARRQVRSFGQFSHPAVVPFVDVGTAGGLHYLVWPLVAGQSLEAHVQQQGRLSAQQTALIAAQVAKGMNAAHQNSIFHGLLKPSNVMIGEDNQARILDFGIGSLLVENDGESLVDTMSTANTLTSGLDCASPESVMDPTNRTPAGDQYSLGCTLYFCLTGRVPFPEGSAVEKMMAHQSKEPPAIKEFAPDCPDGLVAVVARLMAKKPEDRYSGMDEVVEAVEPYLGELASAVAQPVATTIGSAHRIPGLPGGTMARPGGSQIRPGFAMPPQTPTPARTQKGLPTRSGFGQSTPMPTPPGRSNFNQKSSLGSQPPDIPMPGSLVGRFSHTPVPQGSDAVPLVALEPEPLAVPDPARLSAGWTSGPQPERKKPSFGMVGIIAAILAVTALVFLAVKVLVLDK
jgi:serine/threonine-protein kinase